MAVSVCDALVAVIVSHASEYGAVVSSAPKFAPSRRNCTPATPTLSDALAVTVVVPETVAPPAGAVMLTVGAVVSLETVTVTAVAAVVLPAAAPGAAAGGGDPFPAVLDAHATDSGAAVSS